MSPCLYSMRLTHVVAVLLLLPFVFELSAQNSNPISVLQARRTAETIAIDGSLEDSSWMKAPVEMDFTQRDPVEGGAPTERTELRILYDDTSIYFGVRLMDTEPQKIVQRLSRRDDFADADRFTLQLSPNHDRLTGA